MGQPVAVVEKPSARRGIVRFEANRNLTGMGHEHFRSLADAVGPRPAAELARRLFETGGVDAVHIYGNVITVDVTKGHTAAGLQEIIENLYIYYVPGFVLPVFEESVAEDAPAATAGSGGEGGEAAPAALSEAAKRVPPHLLERSRQALAKARSIAAEG